MKSQSHGSELGDQCSPSHLDCESNTFPTLSRSSNMHRYNGGSSSRKKSDYRDKSSQAKTKQMGSSSGYWIDSLEMLSRNNRLASILSRIKSKENSSESNDYPNMASPVSSSVISSIRLRGGVVSNDNGKAAQLTGHQHGMTSLTNEQCSSSPPARPGYGLSVSHQDKLINAKHVQTSARLQMYKQRENMPTAKNPATLIQPPSTAGNSGVLSIKKKGYKKKSGWIN